MAELSKTSRYHFKMRHFYLGEIGHYYLGPTQVVQAIFKCPTAGQIQMSQL